MPESFLLAWKHLSYGPIDQRLEWLTTNRMTPALAGRFLGHKASVLQRLSRSCSPILEGGAEEVEDIARS
jgi:hypothetical protein